MLGPIRPLYKERLESARAQFSVRLKEYLLQVAELERGAQVLAADPASEHVLRPSQLQAGAYTRPLFSST